MTKIQNILRCYATGMDIKAIAVAFNISRNTVGKYVRIYQQSGLSIENLLSKLSHKVQELLGPKEERVTQPSERRKILEVLLPAYAERLKQRGVMVKTLFGDRLEVVDYESGETSKAEVFVAIFPCSHSTYCEAVWFQKKDNRI